MNKNLNVAIIPARGNSKRIPRKNIMEFAGIPLLVHSINYAKSNLNIVDDIYVSTDNQEIKDIALANGVKVIDRPKNLSGDYEPTITAIQHVLKIVENIETIFLLQPTNPLRPDNLLIEAYNLYRKLKLDSLFTVSRDNKKLGKIKNNRYLPFNYEVGQRSQDMEPLYYENGLLYIVSSEKIKEGYIIASDAYPFEINHIFSRIDIDDYEDLEYAEYIYEKTKRF